MAATRIGDGARVGDGAVIFHGRVGEKNSLLTVAFVLWGVWAEIYYKIHENGQNTEQVAINEVYARVKNNKCVHIRKRDVSNRLDLKTETG